MLWKRTIAGVVLAGVALFGSGVSQLGSGVAHAAGRGVTDTSASPHVKLKSVDMDDVRWTDGFWAGRFELCHREMIPYLRKVMELPGNAAVFRNFRIAAGLEEGEFSGTNWGDGDCYKFIEAAAYVYAVTHDDQLDRMMDELVDPIGKAQEPDGYISTQIQLTDKQRWQDLHNHELYNMGHLMTAASIHHRATGKTNFLEIATKLADYLYTVFEPRPQELAHFGFNPSNIMGAAELYRTTGDRKYLKLAGIFVDMRGSVPGGSDQNQAAVPLRKEQEAVGHAVTAGYLYCGAADVVAETGDKALLDALERLWDDVVTRKMYVTGAIGALHHGESDRTLLKRWPRDSVHEAFGRQYQLPNRTAYNETCANIAGAMWNWRMLALSGDAKYADVMERVLYNSFLSSVGIDGKSYFYTNVLRQYGDEMPLLSQDTLERWPDTTERPAPRCFCCPPSVLRTIAKLHGWAYSISAEGVWVHLYGGNVLRTELADGSPLKLTQKTDYPWDGRITITIEEAREEPFGVMLRIPGWASEASVRINGEAADVPCKPGTYASLRRRWSAGDVIQLDLPIRAQLVEANPQVEEARNHVAVMRGPVVYCLESPDLPEGVRVSEVYLPRDVKLTPRHDAKLLGGVTVLEGEAFRIAEGDWSGRLYRPLDSRPQRPEKLKITLIPYYGWANRGVSHMTVWIPAY
jgi:DUF1680 family protein